MENSLQRSPRHPVLIAEDANNLPCRQKDAELWFSTDAEDIALAKKECNGCEVKLGCLAYALANGEQNGVWGGMSEKELLAERPRRNRMGREPA